MTPFTAINQALKKAGIIGIGQTAEAEDINDAFLELQNMLFQWQQRRWLVPGLVDVVATSSGNISYTIGVGGDFDILRPDNIEAAFFRPLDISTNLLADYELEILAAREDYNRIILKNLSTWPQYLFYDSSYPLGTIFINPIPTAGQFELHLSVKTPLPSPNNLTAQMNTPPEYDQAVIYNLAGLLCTSYGLPVPPDVRMIAKDSLNTIRNANSQISRLQMPVGIDGSQGSYSPYSDRIV